MSVLYKELVGQTLCQGQKSPDTELYEFIFYHDISTYRPDYWNNIERETLLSNEEDSMLYVLHILCRFKVIWRNGNKRVDIYHEDISADVFRERITELLGLKVLRADLSDKNDLWLDFGVCWVVFATFESSKESWRLFEYSSDRPHLVASDAWLESV